MRRFVLFLTIMLSVEGSAGTRPKQSKVSGIVPFSSVPVELQGNVKGVMVRYVVPGSAAEDGGLRSGDLILELNGKPVSVPGEFVKSWSSELSDTSSECVHVKYLRVGLTAGSSSSKGTVDTCIKKYLVNVEWSELDDAVNSSVPIVDVDGLVEKPGIYLWGRGLRDVVHKAKPKNSADSACVLLVGPGASPTADQCGELELIRWDEFAQATYSVIFLARRGDARRSSP